MVRRGRECARSSKVRQKRAFLLFPERMEKQRRVEKYAFELVFCDCLFCEFPEKSGVKLIGKLGPYHLATPAKHRMSGANHYNLRGGKPIGKAEVIQNRSISRDVFARMPQFENSFIEPAPFHGRWASKVHGTQYGETCSGAF
ncbi:hypothetical protein [Gordonibacter sp. An230]|uniref:hypothetical protein n=1 Tax=Gordonibacter sp. An230 TaxID=1965592 RepID=UPI0013A60612|nr:hypothetical protein [Gordonibacter sp. An230]